jgi:hypothetical protein
MFLDDLKRCKCILVWIMCAPLNILFQILKSQIFKLILKWQSKMMRHQPNRINKSLMFNLQHFDIIPQIMPYNNFISNQLHQHLLRLLPISLPPQHPLLKNIPINPSNMRNKIQNPSPLLNPQTTYQITQYPLNPQQQSYKFVIQYQ